MEYQQRITKTDLARSTHQVIREAQRGYTVLVENHGQTEVAIVDIIDFQLQRAAIHYFSMPNEYKKDIVITEVAMQALPTDQDRFNLVVGHYLALHLSIGRAAELLRMNPPELQIRLGRSGVPLRMGPESQQELDDEVKTVKKSLRRK